MLLAALATGLWSQTAGAEGSAPSVTSTIPEANVMVGFPAPGLNVGEKKSFSVTVSPADGQAPPTTVRGRFGMPDHGHWTSDEQANQFEGNEMTFDGEFPMPGLYRFRIWLDYADGRETKTAVDFTVAPDKPLDPKVVP